MHISSIVSVLRPKETNTKTMAFPQVYPNGVRHIRSDKRLQDWKVTGKKQIVKCAVNQRQVVIALTGGELVYFEMDTVSVMRDLGYQHSFQQ